MLDVHAPHKPLHGVWEFVLHLFTISIGLLIATQIESCVERHHHVHQAEEARAALRTEIQTNLVELKKRQPELKQLLAWNHSKNVQLRRMREQPQNQKAPAAMDFTWNTIHFQDAAWKTAQSTGALAYMPYQEAQQYSEIYHEQAALLALQDKGWDDLGDLMNRVDVYDWPYLVSKNMVAEQANAELQILEHLHFHLVSEDMEAEACIDLNEAFLGNRSPLMTAGRQLSDK
jgi:hypothetical protein